MYEGRLWRAVARRFSGIAEVDLEDGDIPAGEHVHDPGPDSQCDRFPLFSRPGADSAPVSSGVANVDVSGEKLPVCPRYGTLVQVAVELVPLLALSRLGAGVAQRRVGHRRHESVRQPCPGTVEPAPHGTDRYGGDTCDRCVAGAPGEVAQHDSQLLI